MSETAALNDDFAYAVLSAVTEIPEGKVATYGQIARLIGYPKNARLVARVLSHADYYGDYPCHRVVNASGRLAPGWAAQAMLLQAEGVALIDATHVSLKLYRWKA
ncbi:MGMT family protein [Stomatobaculum longum]|uniref:MGMT family protein n=1 Tax=Stomatobaculum longum TaxID=796942 RepID=UPI0028F0D54F|nr:methylated-DNA--[protein]-cysteine S-methyltransferase [Stomatobaculum longum]